MCKMNKFPKKTLLRALRGIRSFAHSENLRIFLIKLMCSDLHSGSGSCIKVQCSAYRILSIQCCLSASTQSLGTPLASALASAPLYAGVNCPAW